LILRKIAVGTRCHILKLKCSKFDFSWGSTSDPAGRAYSAPPDSPAGLKGPTSKGREGRKDGREGENGVEGNYFYGEGRGKGWKVASWH